jgi:hypothetical protein
MVRYVTQHRTRELSPWLLFNFALHELPVTIITKLVIYVALPSTANKIQRDFTYNHAKSGMDLGFTMA